MYLGKIVEMSPSKELYKNPLHPYTRILISSVPIADPSRKREITVLKGDVPSPINPPSGCSFHPRCPIAVEKCKTIEPELRDVGGEHFVSCHLV
ncbi:MAG: peptide ABC transporter substrate-binding protein, partial [Deltaproteobacteria bacterium]|nr:peptide ABC transporter substrate-binding protein [Deltaproteobacteria bacterium]